MKDNLVAATTLQRWPKEGLEYLGSCPLCSSKSRVPLYKDLVDNLFFCAPGKWALFQCLTCECAYLDPRPNQQTINLAYKTYYTHSSTVSESKNKRKKHGFLSSLRKSLGNGYRNWRYGQNLQPSLRLGAILAFFLRDFKSNIDVNYYHLPKLRANGKLLDIGCGNGRFLKLAQSAGWDVTGVDVDSAAVAAAKSEGLNVLCGGIELFEGQIELFDVIYLIHSIEHMHDPNDVLSKCFQLLMPGGAIHIITPNLNSRGRDIFQENWLALDAPRHLVLFNQKSLKSSLRSHGFQKIKSLKPTKETDTQFLASYKMKKGVTQDQNVMLPDWLCKVIEENHKVDTINLDKSEFLSISGRKRL